MTLAMSSRTILAQFVSFSLMCLSNACPAPSMERNTAFGWPSLCSLSIKLVPSWYSVSPVPVAMYTVLGNEAEGAQMGDSSGSERSALATR